MGPSNRLLLAGAGLVAMAGGLVLLLDGGRSAPLPLPGPGTPGSRDHLPLEPAPPSPTRPREEPGESGGSRTAAAPADDPAAAGEFVRLVGLDGRSPLSDYAITVILDDGGALQDPARLETPAKSDPRGLVDIAGLFGTVSLPPRLFVFPVDPGVRFEPASMLRSELGTTPGAAPRLGLVARPTASFLGRALDAYTGEPIAHMALRVGEWRDGPAVAGAGPSEPRARALFELANASWLVTDGDGRFQSKPLPAGLLRLVSTDNEPVEVEHNTEGRVVEVRFCVGPVLQLDFDPPGGRSHSDFIAGLYRDPAEAGSEEEFQEPASPWAPGVVEDAWGNAAAVMEGSPPWVRLPANERGHPLPSFVILFSRDGSAKGVARIDDFERNRREPLHVDVRELGALAGRVRRDGRDELDGCQLQLFDPSLEEPLASRWLNGRGAFRFQGLAPGAYRLELRAPPLAPQSLDVRVPMSAPIELRLAAVEDDARHVLEVKVIPASGLPLDGSSGRARLSLSISAVGGTGRGGTLEWEGGVGTFRSEGLSGGEYWVHSYFRDGGFEVEPRRPRVTVPCAPVVLNVRDDVEQQRFELWVLNPPSDAELVIEGTLSTHHGFGLSEWLEGDDPLETLPDGRMAQRVALGPYPAGVFESLELRAEGRRTTTLPMSAFTPAGEFLRAEVTLAEGWAAQLDVSDVDLHQSLAGIVLALDGVPLPASDAEGNIQAQAAAKPRVLSVLTPGWELVEHFSWNDWGTVFASGEFTLEGGQLDVFLRRRP